MANPKRALVLAIALAFAGAAAAQRVTTTTSPGATTTNTTGSIAKPTTSAPVPSAAPSSSGSSGSTGSSTSGSSGSSSSGTTSGSTVTGTADTSTLSPSNLTSGTANTLPTGADNAATSTTSTPAPFDSGSGTILGAPVAVTTLPAEDYVIGPNGERIPVNRTATAPATAETQESLAASRALDAKLDKAARDTRERVARKGQVLNSITPRTDVDRTDQMPDDSTPLLSPSRR